MAAGPTSDLQGNDLDLELGRVPSVPELAGLMTRRAMRQDGLDPDDPAHVAQHERDLDLARGRRAVEELARRGVELGTPDEEELVELGQAYAPVELAVILDRIRDEHSPTRHHDGDWFCPCLACYRRRSDFHAGHHHAANESCPHEPPRDWDPDQVQVPNPALDQVQDGARDALSNTPEHIEMGNSDNTDQGQPGYVVREQQRNHVRNVTNGQIRDQDDDGAWSPI